MGVGSFRCVGGYAISAAVVTNVIRDRCRYFRLAVLVSISGWVIVEWQLAEIWTITELSLLK